LNEVIKTYKLQLSTHYTSSQPTFANRQEQTAVPWMKFQLIYRLSMARVMLQQTVK